MNNLVNKCFVFAQSVAVLVLPIGFSARVGHVNEGIQRNNQGLLELLVEAGVSRAFKSEWTILKASIIAVAAKMSGQKAAITGVVVCHGGNPWTR